MSFRMANQLIDMIMSAGAWDDRNPVRRSLLAVGSPAPFDCGTHLGTSGGERH
jgi:hypothetical protein